MLLPEILYGFTRHVRRDPFVGYLDQLGTDSETECFYSYCEGNRLWFSQTLGKMLITCLNVKVDIIINRSSSAYAATAAHLFLLMTAAAMDRFR